MRTLKTGEAAAYLNVSPNTLRSWEQRFGFPEPQRSGGSHRRYAHGEILALREALRQGLSVSSAIDVARDSLRPDVSSLVNALATFRANRAEETMEAAVSLGSVEGAVEGLMLSALTDLMTFKGARSAPLAFGLAWAHDWLRRAQRILGPGQGRVRILIGDCSAPGLDLDGFRAGAFEFFCVRAHADVISLPVRATECLPEAIAALRPNALVLAGRGALESDVARWVYVVRSTTGRLPVALYRRSAPPDAPDSLLSLPDRPTVAQSNVFGLLRTNGRPTNGGH